MLTAVHPTYSFACHLIQVKDFIPNRGHILNMNQKPIFDSNCHHIQISQEVQFVANGIASRTLFHSSHTRMVLFGFSAGQELSEHSSTQHAIVQMLSGEADWTLGGEPRTLRSGDLLYMPPGLPHAVKARQEFSMLLTLTRHEPTDIEARCSCH
jgi:quercetin dioxygenase-like cupin family protein